MESPQRKTWATQTDTREKTDWFRRGVANNFAMWHNGFGPLWKPDYSKRSSLLTMMQCSKRQLTGSWTRKMWHIVNEELSKWCMIAPLMMPWMRDRVCKSSRVEGLSGRPLPYSRGVSKAWNGVYLICDGGHHCWPCLLFRVNAGEPESP